MKIAIQSDQKPRLGAAMENISAWMARWTYRPHMHSSFQYPDQGRHWTRGQYNVEERMERREPYWL